MTLNETEEPQLSPEAEARFERYREGYAAQSWYEIDPRLTSMLKLVFGVDLESEDGSIGLTVVVDGQMISGDVVSQAAWAKLQAESVEKASEYMAKSLVAFQELWEEQATAIRAEESENSLLKKQVRYLHFRGPKVHNHGGLPVTLGPTRVDLRNVSAWSVGSVNYEG
jgi:hypothetical protein